MKYKKSPLELLVAVCEVGNAKQVEQLLNESEAFVHFVLLGSGTSNNPTASLFGFGVLEREIVLAIVNSHQAPTLVQEIAHSLQLDQGANHGVVFTIELSAAEQTFLSHCVKKEV